MTTKSDVFNAGLKGSITASAYVRTLLGEAVVVLVWLGLGWAFTSWLLGLALALWVLIIGPFVLPFFLWRLSRWRGLLRRVDLSDAHDPLSREMSHAFFASLLRNPGPHPWVYVRPARDLSFFWAETSFFSVRSRQLLVLSSAWFEQSTEQRARDWERIWDAMARLSLAQRRLKTLQVLFWLGALSPLEPLLYLFRKGLDGLGFDDLPRPGFWVQRLCWDLRALWFGHSALPRRPEDLPLALHRQDYRLPSVWNSVALGVWFQLPLRAAHPLWTVLTHSDALES